ncbi:MAG: ABC transporter ATP-binding protein [Candidatus Tectomicrobia bacterium]|nr:ABC transporter ATP-binding protein [Candidatus Tectomicrobia bacterium]
MLRVEQLAVSYGIIPAVHDVSLTVNEKEIVSLIGANGAGKTTTLNAISGVLPIRSGRVFFDGQELTGAGSHRIVERGLIQIPEERHLFPDMSVAENLEMGAFSAEARHLARRTLAWVHELFPRLHERRSQLAGTLSGGEQQMLAIGRGLMARPKLLMLDEPSLGLAPLIVDDLFRIMVEINRSDVAILLVEQNAAQALETSHRAYVMENGRITLAGEAQALLEDEQVRAAYLGI